jgi:tripartite-type tricarboxylate transporter receptor subunit TctC
MLQTAVRTARLAVAIMVLLAWAVGLPPEAVGQAFPTRLVKVVVPFPAGGGVDVLGRILAEKLAAKTGQSFVVENRPGASGNVGAAAVAALPADGYALLVTNNSLVTNPAVISNSIDVTHDLAAIAGIATTPVVVAIHRSVPANSIGELIQLLKREPGKWLYSSCGNGTMNHLAGEMFKRRLDIQMGHVAYRGCAPAITDGLGAHTPILFNTVNGVAPYVKGGELKLLATASPARSPLLKDVPALGEVAGLEGFDADIWTGVFAPPRMNRELVQRLNQLVNETLADAEVQRRFAELANSIQPMTPEQMSTLVGRDVERWSKLVKEVGIKAD